MDPNRPRIGDTAVKAVIQYLRHGCRALFHLKWVSASGFHLSAAALLGVAGFLLVIKDGKLRNLSTSRLFLGGESRLGNVFLVPGLQNLGNNCFLNVILQALASSSDFRPFLQRAAEESEPLAVEEQAENLPLTFALATLLEELCVLGEQKVVLSPYKVMLAMTLYIRDFNLTSQQDAAEAFLLLLSSLREEISDCYIPSRSSLADVSGSPNCRILTPGRREDWSEQERWQKYFLGPFNGILVSRLTCQSCSSQISLDYQFFHTLPLSPMLDNRSTIRHGCTLEDCLKQFVVAELVENYHCSNCWHDAAMKYLSLTGADEMEIDKLRRCGGQDACDCRNSFHLETLPWSNNFSRTLKQLTIARCPKILCIHIQRATVNVLGETIKLQGHIAFPLVLDLFPFMTSGVGIKKWGESGQTGQVKLQYHKPSLRLNHSNMKFDAGILNHICRPTSNCICPEAVVADEFGCTEAFLHESDMSPTEHSIKAMNTDSNIQFNNKVNMPCKVAPSENHLYHLIAVVEHFGRAGSGHYTVYRNVKTELQKEDLGNNDAAGLRWFSISDSEVSIVSESDVLAAEASLLFYERV